MMHSDSECEDRKCEDVIDLCSDDDEPLQDDISNTDIGNQTKELSYTQQTHTLPRPATAVDPNRDLESQDSIAVKEEHSSLNDSPTHIRSEVYADQNLPHTVVHNGIPQIHISKKFWKAGDYVASSVVQSREPRGGIDHVRVHPKFLHSNATSHKWAFGAIAELLDNAIDEVQNGATYVKVDAIESPHDSSTMLLVQDDGGGMDPESLRQCMSLGYSQKTNKKTIGQYGNGFKTSTMRLGADVIVFSRCTRNGCTTESIGLLSYTFLRGTGKEDIIVPMVDFELSPDGRTRNILLRATKDDWLENFNMILQWSPYKTKSELLDQFADLHSHGTKVIVYNLWLNDDGELELDFDTDIKDIQLQSCFRNNKSISMQKQFKNDHISSRIRHSLRAYSSILYLHMPERFQIILRGEPVQYFSIAADLKFPEHILYKPHAGNMKDLHGREMSVITTIGFVKEAPIIDVHGFNVYHKNRLIMPFWKVFHDNSSRGKGVVGVLEANFVEPAHDKQDFERTPVLQRLEGRLRSMTIEYWNLHCDLIGYQPPRYLQRQGISTVTPTPGGYNSGKDVNNQQKIQPGRSSPFSQSSAFRNENPFDLQNSSWTSNCVGSRCHNLSVGDASIKNSFKVPTPQLGPDAEVPWKHAETASDRCSNVGTSFQSDGAESSVHIQRSINTDGNHDNIAGLGVVGKRLATEANVQTADQAMKRKASFDMHMTSSSVSEIQPIGCLATGTCNVSALHCTSDVLEELEQLKSRCTQHQREKQQLELKIMKLEQELIDAHYKLQVYEALRSVEMKTEALD